MWSIRTVRQIELVAGLLLVILLFSSCAATSSTQRETGQVIDDATIQAKVKTQLIDDPRVDVEEVNLEVRRGVVTLIGWVDSDNERKAIEDIAWKVNGVTEVENQLQLRVDQPELR